jgi:hypothetical protein
MDIQQRQIFIFSFSVTTLRVINIKEYLLKCNNKLANYSKTEEKSITFLLDDKLTVTKKL